MTFLTTIIPVSGMSSLRKRNLDFICARLNEAFGSENRTVLVFKGDISYSNELAEVSDLSNLEVSSRFLMFLDPDTFFDFKQLRSKVFYYSYKMVVPFSERFHLDENLTRNFIENRSIYVNSGVKVTNTSLAKRACAIQIRLHRFKKPIRSFSLWFGLWRRLVAGRVRRHRTLSLVQVFGFSCRTASSRVLLASQKQKQDRSCF
jgi:hypothetical protein